jgi:hypothetical protein
MSARDEWFLPPLTSGRSGVLASVSANKSNFLPRHFLPPWTADEWMKIYGARILETFAKRTSLRRQSECGVVWVCGKIRVQRTCEEIHYSISCWHRERERASKSGGNISGILSAIADGNFLSSSFASSHLAFRRSLVPFLGERIKAYSQS